MAFRAAEYERFTGTRSRRPAWWPVCTATLRRGWASRWVKLLTFGSLAIAFGFTALFYFAYQVMPNWPLLLQLAGEGDNAGSGFPLQFYNGLLHVFVYPILLPLSLLFGYDLISKDLASNALETYFSRPVTPLAYVIGRTIAYVGFLLLVTLVPLLWIWLFDVSTGPDGRFDEISGVPLALIQGLAPVALVLALFIQAVSSVTKSGIWTNLAVVVLFFFGFVAGQILYEESGRTVEIELTAEEAAEEAEELRQFQEHIAELEAVSYQGAAAEAAAETPVAPGDRVVTRTGPNGERVRVVIRGQQGAEAGPAVPAPPAPEDGVPRPFAAGLSEALPGPAQVGLTLALFTYLSGSDWRAILMLGLVPAMMVPEADAQGLAKQVLGLESEPRRRRESMGPVQAPSGSRRVVTYNDPRMLAVSITEVIRGWCVGCLEQTYPEEVRASQERRRRTRHSHQTERMVPLELARDILLGLGGSSLLVLFLRLRKRGMVG
ncbi:MAG: hypothetical protein ISR76_02345 [Planctomycetes bacterium]|nr:hypothetical protein [Planctomycetota bacterium]